MRHAERTENFALAECVETFIGKPFECDAKNDESDVAVFGARAGVGGKRSGEGGLQQGITRRGAQEKLFVSWQAGAVSEQHAQSNFAAARTISGEFGNDGSDRSFKIEQAALVENHRHGGCGNDLGERSEIEQARGGDLGRRRIVGETAKRLVGDEFSAKSDGERTAGENAGGDGLFENAESVAKALILRGEIAREERKTGFSIWQRQVQGTL